MPHNSRTSGRKDTVFQPHFGLFPNFPASSSSPGSFPIFPRKTRNVEICCPLLGAAKFRDLGSLEMLDPNALDFFLTLIAIPKAFPGKTRTVGIGSFPNSRKANFEFFFSLLNLQFFGNCWKQVLGQNLTSCSWKKNLKLPKFPPS